MRPKVLSAKSCSSFSLSRAAGTAQLKLLADGNPTIEKSGAPVDLQGARSGDPSAWEKIFRRYGKTVSATVRSFRLQEADALDAVQTTWLRLAENVDQIQNQERLGAWLTTTARRECLRMVVRATRVSHLN